jgi:hypothetical protein
MKTIMLALAVTSGLLIATLGAQSGTDTTKAGQMMPGKMMSGGMMSQMPQMMMGQNETSKLVDQLAKSFAAMEAEKDPVALRTKLTEHGALLKELQTKVQAQSHMMEMMRNMNMMNDQQKGDAHDHSR